MIEYKNLSEAYGPLLVVKDISNAKYDELVTVVEENGDERLGKVLETSENSALIQLFTSAQSLNLASSKVRLSSHAFEIKLSRDILGRVFNGLGKPVDGAEPIISNLSRDINGSPINPCSREYPSEFIQTGISSIDGLNTLVRGQKLPIFSMSGLPHAKLAVDIASHATLLDKKEDFAVVFCGIGITFEESQFYINSLKKSGALKHSVVFTNLVSDPVIERISTPRIAMTCAEYL